MRIFSRFFFQSTSALLVVGLVVLLGIVGMTYWLGARAGVYFEDVIAARDARAGAGELRNAIQTAESSQRGFLITGNEIYLAPYDTARGTVERQMTALRKNFASYANLAPLVERLTEIVDQKLLEMDSTIALKRERLDDQANAVIRSNRGKALMDEANVLFSGAVRAADARLTAGVSEHRANASLLRVVSLVGGVVIIIVVGIAALAVVRHTRDLRQARDEVTVLNHELEARVRNRTADLVRANDEVQRFAYIVTHDLRAPLVNIMGFTSELERGLHSLQAYLDTTGRPGDARKIEGEARLAASEDLPEAITFIRSSTKKMDNLINAILKISREGRRSLRPESVDIGEVLDVSAAAVQHQLNAAAGSIEIDANVPPIVSDRFSLEQVFSNIFDNAIKYRCKDRAIRIRAWAVSVPGGQMGIHIADNGRGIAEHDLERVFELFRRAGEQDQPGDGVGLASVRILARNLGGDVTVESRIGEGTTFHVFLPRKLELEDGKAA